MDILQWALFVFIGLVAGFFSGVIGIGGGFLIVPTLYWVLTLKGYSEPRALAQSIATSLGVMIFTTSASAISHALKKATVWRTFFFITLGSLFGAILGPFFSNVLPTDSVKVILAIFEILVGVYLIFRLTPKEHIDLGPKVLSPFFYIPFGFVVAVFGSLVGVGGGIFIVPMLIMARYPIKNAVATSSICIVPLALIATLTYVILAQKNGPTPIGQVINIPALICMSVAAIIASPIGVMTCHKVSDGKLRVFFGIVLITLGVLFFV